MNLLLQHCSKTVNPSDKYEVSYFHIACSTENVSLVESFINNGVSLDSCVTLDSEMFGFTPLYYAIAYNQKSIVELLLQHNVDIDSKLATKTALHVACNQEYIFKYNDLSSKNKLRLNKNKHSCKNIDWSQNRDTQIAIVKLLLEHGADVHAKDSNGLTCLMHVYKCDLLENAAVLGLGLSENSLSFYGNACGFKSEFIQNLRNTIIGEFKKTRIEITRVLLSHKLDINAKGRDSGTILHYICSLDKCNQTDTEEMAMLLSNGTDVNAVDDNGGTPLHSIFNKNEDTKSW